MLAYPVRMKNPTEGPGSRVAGATRWLLLCALTITLGAVACAYPDSGGDTEVSLTYEKNEQANALDVILHIDRTDPIAALAMTYHVGSSREVAG